MKPHWFFILLSVSAGPRYGTAIQDDVRELSGGDVRLWPATLYGSLEDLVEYGWIEEAADPPGQESERKRYYRITRSGQAVARGETRRLSELVRVARSRVKARGETA